MSRQLEPLPPRLATEDPTVLAVDLERAFVETMAADPAGTTPRMRELHELLRFCRFDALAPWLAHEREALNRVPAFAQGIVDEDIARARATAPSHSASFPATAKSGC